MADKLPFITDRDLERHVWSVIDTSNQAVDNEDEDEIHKNVVDPFSAVFDSMRKKTSIHGWLTFERERQIQKTIQNAIGKFHQNIIGSISGWENLGVGNLVDVRNANTKVIAEIKNKHNTVKGSDLVVIYDELKTALTRKEYIGYQAYYVEIIPKKGESVEPFTPPDNKTQKKRKARKDILRIDGRSFYKLATGIPDALDQLYEVLPQVIGDFLKADHSQVTSDPLFKELFDRAFLGK